MKVKLCAGCIEDLLEYNPYIVPITIIKVKDIKDCDNHNIDDWNLKYGKKHKRA